MNSLKLVGLVGLTIAVAACGGGGGGGGSTPAPAPSPSPSPSGLNIPAAPSEQASGLQAPTLTLSTSVNGIPSDFAKIAAQMITAYDASDEAAAARELAQITRSSPGSSSCPGGGTVNVTVGAPATYAYTNCVTNGFSFNGNASLTGDPATSYSFDFAAVTVTEGGSTRALGGRADCTVAGTAANCKTTQSSFVWGYDVVYDLAQRLADGAHRCECSGGSWNVVFDGMGAASGRAYVYASNGATALVERTGARSFRVSRELSGQVVSADINVP